MSSDFEWHFGDEFPDDQPEEMGANRSRWRRLVPWILTLLVIAAGATLWWRDRQRNLAEAEAEVLRVARLEFRALTEGDSELYLSLQDYYDRSWKRAQAAYVDTGGLPLPLQDVTTPVSTTVESARVVGDRAQVEVVHTTTLPSGEEASFRAVRFYRYMPDGRWMHTNVGPDAGGRPVTFVVDGIEITAAAEDTEWIDPLTAGLADAAYRFCDLTSCRQDPAVTLNLAANLEEGAEPDGDVLPAPFLVGAPENDAARAAWKASLADFLVDRLVAQEIRAQPDDEHGGVLFEERLRAWLKAELGVSERIVPDRDLLRDALDSDVWLPTWHLWHVPPDDPDRDLAAAQIDLLLAFIEEEHGSATVAGLLPQLHDADHLSELLSGVEGRSVDLEARFVAYARKQTAEAADELASFDRYDLLMRCSETIQSTSLSEIWGWRLDPEEAVLLSVLSAEEGFTPLSWSPDGTRLLVEQDTRHGSRLSLLQAGSGELEDSAFPENAQPVDYWISDSSPWPADGSCVAYRVYVYEEEPESRRAESRIVRLSGSEAVTIAIEGTFVAWSPDGTQVLHATPVAPDTPADDQSSVGPARDFFVAYRDGSVSRWIGRGYAAAWAPDGQRVAIIDSEEVLQVTNIETGLQTTMLERGELRDAVGFAASASPNFGVSPLLLTWSPDGEGIALASSLIEDDNPKESAIVLVQDDGYRILRRDAGGIFNMAWASEGGWLAALAFRAEGFETVVMARDGSVALREKNALGHWAPHGQAIALTRMTEQGTDTEIIDIATDRRTRIDLPGDCWWFPVWNPRSSLRRPAHDD